MKALGRAPTRDDFVAGWHEGTARAHAAHERAGQHHTHGYEPTRPRDLQNKRFSAISENFTAIVTGRVWGSRGGLPDHGKPDVVGGPEAKWRPWHGSALHVYGESNALRPYVLWTGLRFRDFRCEGWREGVWIMQPKYWLPAGSQMPNAPLGTLTKRDAYWLPNEELIDPSLSMLMLYEGEDPGEATLLARLADNFEWDKWVGRHAFGIDYGDGIVYNRT